MMIINSRMPSFEILVFILSYSSSLIITNLCKTKKFLLDEDEVYL